MPQPSRANLFWLAAYLATMVLIVFGLLRARRSALVRLDTPEARADWEAWRQAVREAGPDSPVKRREPKSPEPNLLVLLRDYFGVCVTAGVLFTSLLFGVLMIFLRGAFGAPGARQTAD